MSGTPTTFEPNDHFTSNVPQYVLDRDRVCNLQQQLQVMAGNCQCLDGGVCLSGTHNRYQALMHDLKTEGDATKHLFTDVTSCADTTVATINASNGLGDTVRLGLDTICTTGGVRGQVMEEHPHNVLSMIQAIAEVPRKTSTVMSIRSDRKLNILPAFVVHGAWYGAAARRICGSCARMQLDFWWSWALKRGAEDQWRLEPLEPSCDGDLPCGVAHAWAAMVMTRTGCLGDGIFGDHCSHVALSLRVGSPAYSLSRYITLVMFQAAGQVGGKVGNHAGGWGAARVLATVMPVWDELWAALAADGESTVPVATGAAYALGSDYAKDVHCSVEADGMIHYIMYDDHAGPGTSVVLHKVTIQKEYSHESGQPVWAMALIKMWRDYTVRHWQVDKDMCFDRYVRAFLKKDSVKSLDKPTCNLADVSWRDVRNWHYKNRGAIARASDILTSREV